MRQINYYYSHLQIKNVRLKEIRLFAQITELGSGEGDLSPQSRAVLSYIPCCLTYFFHVANFFQGQISRIRNVGSKGIHKHFISRQSSKTPFCILQQGQRLDSKKNRDLLNIAKSATSCFIPWRAHRTTFLRVQNESQAITIVSFPLIN